MKRKSDLGMGNRSHNRWTLAAIGFLVLVMGLAVFLLSYKKSAHLESRRREMSRTESRGPKVEMARVTRSEPGRVIDLIGITRPFFTVTLFARVSGYLADIRADIGDAVNEGELLAQVESPEAEQAYSSAYADSKNKRLIANRMKILLKRKLVSPQEAQQAIFSADIAEATLRTQAVIRSYQSIKAPFTGVITQRFADPGALLQNASSSQSASQPLFTLSQINRMRIFFFVDQTNAPFVHLGDPVEIRLYDSSKKGFSAKIDRIAGELDPNTRTLQTEVDVDNPDESIVPGSFVRVQLKIQRAPYLELPVEALVIQNEVPFVPVIGPQQEIHYQRIDLAENDGKHLFIRSGVEEGAQVALNIGNSLRNGQKVQVVESGSLARAGEKAKDRRSAIRPSDG